MCNHSLSRGHENWKVREPLMSHVSVTGAPRLWHLRCHRVKDYERDRKLCSSGLQITYSRRHWWSNTRVARAHTCAIVFLVRAQLVTNGRRFPSRCWIELNRDGREISADWVADARGVTEARSPRSFASCRRRALDIKLCLSRVNCNSLCVR